jgi:threonine synthase
MSRLVSVSGVEQPKNYLGYLAGDGGLLKIESDIAFDPHKIDQRVEGMWRYHRFIPMISDIHISLGEMITPILRDNINGSEVWMKAEYLFPTGSYKDRGAAVLLSRALSLGVRSVLEDSSGNAGCAVSAYAARAGISCTIVVPQNASEAKIRQMQHYGATIVKVPGNRGDAANEALSRAGSQYFASHTYNPWFFQGTKTFLYEIFEQTSGNLPDEIIFPAGNGTLILGTAMALEELKRGGYRGKMPALSIVQAKACCPIARKLGVSVSSEPTPTIAEGIAVANPVRLTEILEAIRETGGNAYTVSEQEIMDAHNNLATRGIYVEYTSAAGFAAILKTNCDHIRLIPLTGSGLKNIM